MFKNIKEIKPHIHQQHLLLLGIMALCIWLQWFDFTNNLRYDRELIIAGEWYRLISANFVHLNTVHLLMNILGLVIALLFFSDYLKSSQWIILIAISTLIVSLGLLWRNSDILYYVGLSGILHAVFVTCAIIEVRRFPISGYLLISFLFIKLLWEQYSGPIPGSESIINGNVVVDSHLYGAMAGLFFIMFLVSTKKNVFFN